MEGLTEVNENHRITQVLSIKRWIKVAACLFVAWLIKECATVADWKTEKNLTIAAS